MRKFAEDNKKKDQRKEANFAKAKQAKKAGITSDGADELDDKFDHLLSKYKSRVLKKIKQVEVGESGASFQEVEYSD